MTRLLLLTLITARAFLAAEPGFTTPDPAQAGMNAQRLARIPVRMQSFVEEGKAAGIVTLVMRHGHLASLSAVGYQDLESKTPMRTSSIFQIMSLTKAFTAAAVMILMEEGKLALSDPVEKHLPAFHLQQVKGETKPARAITIFDLLTHTSGVSGRGLKGGAPPTLAEYSEALARLPLEFNPGTEWRYSSEGIDLLGRIIEVVSGQPYDRFVADRIFGPLDMKDTSFQAETGKKNRIATVYTEENGHLKLAAPRNMNPFPNPGGGIFSTATDLARFYQMLLGKGTLGGRRILSAASVEAMTTVQTGDLAVGFAPGMGYGFGLGVIKEPKGMFRLCSIGSFGHGGAYRTYGWVDPAKDLIRIILLQRTNGGGDTADEINAFLAMAAAAIER